MSLSGEYKNTKCEDCPFLEMHREFLAGSREHYDKMKGSFLRGLVEIKSVEDRREVIEAILANDEDTDINFLADVSLMQSGSGDDVKAVEETLRKLEQSAVSTDYRIESSARNRVEREERFIDFITERCPGGPSLTRRHAIFGEAILRCNHPAARFSLHRDAAA